MEITDIDPLQNNLLFERFLNPERISMPDIDIDFCMNRRGEVIDYVTRKYGRDQVAQIITFNTMAARAAIKDVGRALDLPYGEVDRVAKMVPATIGVTITKALQDSPQMQEAYDKEPQVRELVDTARKLEGLVRGAGLHAAGVVIAPTTMTELVPVCRSKNDEVVTAYDMKAVEKLGLLKMDFLGLTTLTVIDDALKLIERKRGSALDMSLISLDDTETYEKVFHRALTSGVFQFESGGMRDVLRRYKPTCVEDLTALNALYRPGPIQGGMIDDFIERKWGRRVVSYELPELEALLKETLGVIVYQEQVMQIANVLAGYSLGEADLLRRAMGKKNPEEMAKQRTRFVEGAIQRKHPKDKVVRIFDLMEQFAGYGFNKSHSAAYALLAYHTAYLKTHYPIEFMAALLTSEISKPENVVKYIKECREMGISVEPPDVQISGADFTPSATGIRFGLTAIKNVGRNAIDSILIAREQNGGFPTLWEFCEKVDLRLMNKRVLESLIKAGALDGFGRRSQLIAVADRAMERAQQAQRDLLAGQHGLFAGLAALFEGGGGNGHKSADDLPNTPDWDENERLQAEKEVLGFFVSGHPLDKYAEKLRNLNVVDTATALEMKAPLPARRRNGGGEPENLLAIAGVIVGLKEAKSKRSGEMYAQASLEDTVGKIDLICFPKDYARLCESLKIEVPVLIKGVLRADDDESAPKLSVSSIQPLEDIKIKLPQNVRIRVLLESASEAMLGSLRAMITAAPGPGRLMINLESRGEYCVMLEPEGLTVGADRGFIERAEQLLGQGAVQAFE
jgi:DNA polymerase-3 subunit alpha